MYFCTARVIRNAPLRCTFMTMSQSSSDILNSMLSRVTPALLISTVGAPSSSATRATAASTWAGSLTSAPTAIARPPADSIASTVPFAEPSSRSSTPTAKPSSASRRAVAAPIPRAAPVTMATRAVPASLMNRSLRLGAGCPGRELPARSTGPRRTRYVRARGGPASGTGGRGSQAEEVAQRPRGHAGDEQHDRRRPVEPVGQQLVEEQLRGTRHARRRIAPAPQHTPGPSGLADQQPDRRQLRGHRHGPADDDERDPRGEAHPGMLPQNRWSAALLCASERVAQAVGRRPVTAASSGRAGRGAGCSTRARTRPDMNRAVRTGVPPRVVSVTSTTPRPWVTSTRRPARGWPAGGGLGDLHGPSAGGGAPRGAGGGGLDLVGGGAPAGIDDDLDAVALHGVVPSSVPGLPGAVGTRVPPTGGQRPRR